LPWPAPRLDLTACGPLTFESPDHDLFPALGLAKAALAAGGYAPAAMNAANEVGVAAFLDRRIGFLDIAGVVAETLERMQSRGFSADGANDPVAVACEADSAARRTADEVIARLSRVAVGGRA
jgi:1-deoxy-D-xylulose-5-phosphate reductoisomerase